MRAVRSGPSSILRQADVQFLQCHLLRRLSFPYHVFPVSLSEVSGLCMRGFTLGPCPVPLADVSVLTLALYCFDDGSFVTCESREWRPPALSFLPEVALAAWGLLWFQTDVRIVFTISVKNVTGTWTGIALNL